MDHEQDDNLRYVSVTDEMGESIAQTSDKMFELASTEAGKVLDRNTTMEQVYVWMICTCAATLARCLLQDRTAAGTNLSLAVQYIKHILRKVP